MRRENSTGTDTLLSAAGVSWFVIPMEPYMSPSARSPVSILESRCTVMAMWFY